MFYNIYMDIWFFFILFKIFRILSKQIGKIKKEFLRRATKEGNNVCCYNVCEELKQLQHIQQTATHSPPMLLSQKKKGSSHLVGRWEEIFNVCYNTKEIDNKRAYCLASSCVST